MISNLVKKQFQERKQPYITLINKLEPPTTESKSSDITTFEAVNNELRVILENLSQAGDCWVEAASALGGSASSAEAVSKFVDADDSAVSTTSSSKMSSLGMFRTFTINK